MDFCLYGYVLIFAADMHLRPEAEDDAARFVRWTMEMRARAESVYILGDLFDYWYTGLERRFPVVTEALSSSGIHVMRGNRDFLLGNGPLPGLDIVHDEEITITVGTRRVLLAHGHTLAASDRGFKLLHAYGWPAIERLDRACPMFLKDLLARFMVSSSRTFRASSVEIPEDTVRSRGVDLVICGHLHRRLERGGLMVLPAFCDTGSWLEWDEAGPGGPILRGA
jgi:UDP-2,3-diacylglucosamine hydrolase